MVSISYELYHNDAGGELMERMDAFHPFIFLFGTGKLLKHFENQLEGLSPGDPFEFTLTADQAYGHHDPDQVIEVPIDSFRVDGELHQDLLQEGQHITMTSHDGKNHTGKVLRVKRKKVIVDFNHSMVEKTLFFTGMVLEVRDAQFNEIVNQRVQQ